MVLVVGWARDGYEVVVARLAAAGEQPCGGDRAARWERACDTAAVAQRRWWRLEKRGGGGGTSREETSATCFNE
jgi:hypothetical protein